MLKGSLLWTGTLVLVAISDPSVVRGLAGASLSA